MRRELPKLDNFVTLSPVPGFVQWLKQAPDVPVSDEDRALLGHLDTPDWTGNAELVQQLRTVLEPLAAYYFLKARTPKGRLIDSVARFHLGNGARLERIDWLGDLSPKGLRESAGIMVNYLYRLDDIEKNHEAYANRDEIAASSAVKKLLKTEGRRLLDMRLTWRPGSGLPWSSDLIAKILRDRAVTLDRQRIAVAIPGGAGGDAD